MEELKDFTLADLYDRLNWDDFMFLEWLQNMHLIPTSRKCQCGAKMRLRNQRPGETYQNWQGNNVFYNLWLHINDLYNVK